MAALDPISGRWWDIGEALGISEQRLEKLRKENSEVKIRLFYMVEHYFEVKPRPKWIDIARALRKIGEIEPANKIERTNGLQGILQIDG